jgi:hypothetical protein
MPSTPTRSTEAAPSSYESAEKIQLKPHKARVVVQRRSFKDLVSQNQLPPSPADSDSADHQMPAVSTLTMEQRRIVRDIARGSPSDQTMSSDTKSPGQLARQRSQYYEDTFTSREVLSSARERVSRESMVMADIRTNVIVSSLVILHIYMLMSRRFKTSTPLSPIYPTLSQPATNDPSPAS